MDKISTYFTKEDIWIANKTLNMLNVINYQGNTN